MQDKQPGKEITRIYSAVQTKYDNYKSIINGRTVYRIGLIFVVLFGISNITDNPIFLYFGILLFIYVPFSVTYHRLRNKIEPMILFENGIVQDDLRRNIVKSAKRTFIPFNKIRSIDNIKENEHGISVNIELVDDKKFEYIFGDINKFNLILKTINEYYGQNKFYLVKKTSKNVDKWYVIWNYLLYLILIYAIFFIIFIFSLFLINEPGSGSYDEFLFNYYLIITTAFISIIILLLFLGISFIIRPYVR